MHYLNELSDESSLALDSAFSFTGLLKKSSLSDFSLLATDMLRPEGGGHDGDGGQLGRLHSHWVVSSLRQHLHSSLIFSLLASQLFTVVYFYVFRHVSFPDPTSYLLVW
jgi:hypothetical protein